MPGSYSWMPYAPQGVKGFDDDDWCINKTGDFLCQSLIRCVKLVSYINPLALELDI